MTNSGKIGAGVALIVLFASTGCSSIIEGRSQEIFVNTNPPGAFCDLIRKDKTIAQIAKTPAATTIEKTKDDIRIECTEKGFHKAVYYNHSGAAGATFGNIVLGGGIGWAIDSASGSDNKYTSPVNLTMVPLSEPKPAPVYSEPPEKTKSDDSKTDTDSSSMN